MNANPELKGLGFRVRKAIANGYQVPKDKASGKVDPVFQLEVGSPFPDAAHAQQQPAASDDDVEMMETDEPSSQSSQDVPRASSVFFSGAPMSNEVSEEKYTTIEFGAAGQGNQEQQQQPGTIRQAKLSEYFGQKST